MGNRIRQVREGLGLSLEELAKRASTSNQQISHLEKGKRRLTVDWLMRLAAALDCHPMELIDASSPASERERDLLAVFRKLSSDQQEALVRLVLSIAKPKEADSTRSVNLQ